MRAPGAGADEADGADGAYEADGADGAYEAGEAGEADGRQLPAGWDRLVGASADIDRFCSSSDWIVPAQRTWGGEALWPTASDDAALVLARVRASGGAAVWCGLDPVWGFACPAVGPEPAEVARLVVATLAEPGRRWDAVLLTGLVPGSPREAALRAELAGRFPLRPGPSMTRRRADLTDGLDAYLRRRSARFRRNLARAERARREAGVAVELVVGGGSEVVERCLAIERRSWKGRRGGGLSDRAMARFYAALAERLAPSGRLRTGFARFGGRDVGYILGAVRNGGYRGLQLSFDDEHAGLSLGNLLQLHQMEALVDEGMTSYDLGMDMEYKRRWADDELTTTTLGVLAAPGGARRRR